MEQDDVAKPHSWREWRLPAVLFVLTFASMLYVGAINETGESPALSTLWTGWTFAVPMMAILLSHEMGHYVAGRIHGVDISPPFFIPMPFVLFGTFGAVIRMRGRIRSRNALLDVGAAGPIAGIVVAIPVLLYGVAASPVEPLPPRDDVTLFLEGHSIFYELVLYLLKGPIPAGSDISLTPTALAGWAGLLVTLINLIPFGQLDGGHVAYAVWGERQDRYSKLVIKLLPVVGLVAGAYYGGWALIEQQPWKVVGLEALAGQHWFFWALLLAGMSRYAGWEHPPTDDSELSPRRRAIAYATLALFVLLFMPSWIRGY